MYIKENHNLTKDETQALYQLQHNKNIVIKPADKWSAVVIMDREAYITEATRQLNDIKYYRKLTQPIFTKTIPIIKRIDNTLINKRYITLT